MMGAAKRRSRWRARQPKTTRACGYFRVLPHVRGVATALTRGLEAARGEFIARIDADDLCAPSRTRIQLAFLRANEHVHVVGSAVSIERVTLGSSSAEACAPAANERVVKNPASPLLVHFAMPFFCAVAHPSVLARRGVLDYSDGCSRAQHPCEDYAMWFRLLERGVRIANLDGDPLVTLRRHGANVSTLRAHEQRTAARAEALAALTRALESKHSNAEWWPILPSLVDALPQPSRAPSSTTLAHLLSLLRAWESHVLASHPTAPPSDQRALQVAARARRAEVCAIAASVHEDFSLFGLIG